MIVRGGENMSPGEIEDVLRGTTRRSPRPPWSASPTTEWGEKVVAAVVLARPGPTATEDELQTWVRERLRSSRTPEHIEFRAELPYNETGKLLRRVLRTELAAEFAPRRAERAALGSAERRIAAVRGGRSDVPPWERAIPPPARARARGARPPVDHQLRPPPLPDRARRLAHDGRTVHAVDLYREGFEAA